MYHGNVGRKLAEYLPQQLFAWAFGDDFQIMNESDDEVTVVRTGTITFNLGWWRRQMFWNNVVKILPDGQKFPFSKVEEFDDCKQCAAKMVFKLKRGGLGLARKVAEDGKDVDQDVSMAQRSSEATKQGSDW